ncbi:MAG: STAS domain-containing protein [Melioribacteraceae bacterium]|nr:STAS domain-containing protein [Melioribacteraceae bacterium]MCF8265446.1 STAS domain-containing protein [Melioribacteraceae bacterium]MCF8413551.1 STAS domain-containing protein [Melioribacteraceae bacterium]MCF8431385.1 STAS domain-containing protein [Melioribacteraceae bacterium]
MNFSVIEHNNVYVIKMKGNIIGGPDSDQFHNFIRKGLLHDINNFVIDLSGVRFVSSTGIGVLIRGFTNLKAAGGEMKLAKLPDKVKGILSITKLTTIFDIHADVKQDSTK